MDSVVGDRRASDVPGEALEGSAVAGGDAHGGMEVEAGFGPGAQALGLGHGVRRLRPGAGDARCGDRIQAGALQEEWSGLRWLVIVAAVQEAAHARLDLEHQSDDVGGLRKAPGSCSVAGRCAFDCPIEGANPFPELRGEGAEAADGADASEGDADAEGDAGSAPDLDSGPAPAEPDAADETPTGPPRGDSGCGAAPASAPLPLLLLALVLGAWCLRRRGWV